MDGSDFQYLDIELRRQKAWNSRGLFIAYLMGQNTKFTFSDIREGTDISLDLFSFTPPEGTEIVVNK